MSTNEKDAVLCDFELLREEAMGGATSGYTTVVGGTPAYMAPERVQGAKPSTAADMYSVGVVMLLCFTPSQIAEVTGAERRPPLEVLSHVRVELPSANYEMDLVAAMLGDAHARPSARSLLDHVDSYFSRSDEVPMYWRPGQGELLEVTDAYAMERIIQALHARMPDQFGKGRDGSDKPWNDLGLLLRPDGTSDRSVAIVKAWHIQNQSIWKQYSAAVERIADDISRGPPISSDDAPVCNRAKIMRPKLPNERSGCSKGGEALELAAQDGFKADHEDAARQDINEVFLLHGLPKGTVFDVIRSGFNERYSGANAGALFGDGSYFAQDIEKADQYTGDPDHNISEPGLSALHKQLYPNGADDHPGDVCYVLVCRVALGYTIRTKGRFFNSKTQKHQRQCTAMDTGSSELMQCRDQYTQQVFKSKGRGFVFVNVCLRDI